MAFDGRRLARAVTLDRTIGLCLGAVVLAMTVVRPITDPDLGWHLAAGEWMWTHRAIPHVDPFGLPTAGMPWVPYSWLAELAFWIVTTRLGAHVLVVACGLLVSATFVLGYHTCRARGAHPMAAAGVTLSAALAALPFTSQRPVVFSFLALALCARTLWRATRGAPVSLAAHATLFVVWANVHVFFVVGLAWLWAAPLAAWAEQRRWQKYVPVALAATAATFCSPFGLALHRELLTLSAEPVLRSKIAEFMSPNFHTLPGVFILGFLVLMGVALRRTQERISPVLALGIAAHTVLALYMQRNVPLLVILAAPAVARGLSGAWHPAPARPADTEASIRIVLHAAVAGLALLLVVRTLPTQPALEANLDRSSFPIGAVRFLQEQPPLGRMFNPFGWGGYLLHTLYPRYQVSIDGRTQTYGGRNAVYLKTHYLQDGWQEYLDTIAPDIVVWQRDTPFAQLLASRSDWRRVYADDVAVVFVHATDPRGDALRRAGRAAVHRVGMVAG